MKVQVTTALSQLVSQGLQESEVISIRKALRALPLYAATDSLGELSRLHPQVRYVYGTPFNS